MTKRTRAQPSNPPPRLFLLPQDEALLNRMGFNNDRAAVVPTGRKRHAQTRRPPLAHGQRPGATKKARETGHEVPTENEAVHEILGTSWAACRRISWRAAS